MDPYELVTDRERKNGFGLRLQSLLSEILRPGEKLILAASPARATGTYFLSCAIVITDQRLLLLRRSDVKILHELTRKDIRITKANANGIAIQAADGTRALLNVSGKRGNGLMFGSMRRLIYGPTATPGGRDTDRSAVSPCYYLGGHGMRLELHTECTLAMNESTLSVMQTDGTNTQDVRLADLDAIDIQGKDAYTTGGGFVGGGFFSPNGQGADAVAEGMAVAALLNKLTTTEHIDTLIRVRGPGLDLYYRYHGETSEDLRIRLSWIAEHTGHRRN
jgi:hypothetical protein